MSGHLVFVYGTLKSGKGNNGLLSGAEFIGPATTAESYGMERNGAPRVYRDPPKRYAAPVMGEVYAVDDDTLARLDALERHPDWYRREQVKVIVDSPRGPHGPMLLAWLYFVPKTHARAANDLYKHPVYVKGVAVHTWGIR